MIGFLSNHKNISKPVQPNEMAFVEHSVPINVENMRNLLLLPDIAKVTGLLLSK